MYLNTTFYVIAFGVQTSQPQQVQLKQTSATETNASGNELTTPATVQGNRSQTEKDTVELCDHEELNDSGISLEGKTYTVCAI
jgi:hypothetical protein